MGNGCVLADYPFKTVVVDGRPSAVSMTLTDENNNRVDTLCGNDVNSIINLTIVFSGLPPYIFELSESKEGGVTRQNFVSPTNTFTMQIVPEKTTRYTVTMLNDATNCPAYANTLTVSAVLYVTSITNIAATSACGEIVAGMNPLARVYFDIVSLPATGTAPTVRIEFVDPNYAAFNTTGTIVYVDGTLNYVEFETPTDAGDYQMKLIINGCEYPFILQILASNKDNLVVQRWDDVLVVNNNPDNNGGYTFTSYQWYKDGVAIPGATGQYYQEVGGVNGTYSVMLTGTDANGNPIHIMTCDMYFVGKKMMKLYPNPAQTFQTITIQMSLSAEELDGAVLDVYTITGQHLRTIEVKSNIIKIDGFAVPGSYVGKITTGTKEVKSVKMVVIQ
jgi:hypothetical protein